MIEHLKKYVGIYLAILVGLLIYFDDPNDEYPVIVTWFILAIILFKFPPFNWGDWLITKWSNFLWWILGPFIRWQQTSWPKWAIWIWVILCVIGFEEWVFKPLGYTIYPWRYAIWYE